MRTLSYCIYYDPAWKNAGLEWRRLLLTLLASDIVERIANCYSGRVGPRNLRWEPGSRTLGCDSKVGPEVGTLRWDSWMGP